MELKVLDKAITSCKVKVKTTKRKTFRIHLLELKDLRISRERRLAHEKAEARRVGQERRREMQMDRPRRTTAAGRIMKRISMRREAPNRATYVQKVVVAPSPRSSPTSSPVKSEE